MAKVCRVRGVMTYLTLGGARHGDSAMCCGFGVEAHAGAKKLVRRGRGVGREARLDLLHRREAELVEESGQ